ncbi:phosphotransferase [Pseudonocardia sp.]|uniref:maltokinase N-terminal cap-like domain-containing protein n=1 Tax=Pseudonocardia sp. TaxID=60912 RepID=UPI0026141DA3|nr:phosphotransferase [Pseudonocardia sp.]
MTLAEELPTLLPEWLARQRWFAAKGRPVRSTAVASDTPLIDGPDLRLNLLLVAVTFDDDGSVQHYQLPLARRDQLSADLAGARIGRIGDADAYDGLVDTEVTAWLLEAIRAGRTTGEVRFVPEPGASMADPGPGRPIGVEQSNTSVSWGDRSILKVFRRVLPGVSADLEMHRALRTVGSHQVAALQGAIEGTLDGEPVTLGMLSDFAANSGDGWALALSSVQNLFTSDAPSPAEAPGDFAAEASRLGETLAVVHAELRRALGEQERDPAELAAVWHERLAAIVGEIPSLGEHADPIRAVYDAVAALGTPIPTQRVHGDLHLGQTLRTPRGWLVIDFEGEPAAPLAERVRPDPAMRDVAGMLFSFDYAASHHLLQSGPLTGSHPDRNRADEWAARNRTAFCAGYAQRGGSDPREHGALLRAYELDKAVYQVLYETRSRPTWVSIPLATIVRLTSEAGSGAVR